eukprot:3938800-Amphidinium_carterae.2
MNEANIYTSGADFAQLADAYVRLVNADTNQELARMQLAGAGLKGNALVFSKLYKVQAEWLVKLTTHPPFIQQEACQLLENDLSRDTRQLYKTVEQDPSEIDLQRFQKYDHNTSLEYFRKACVDMLFVTLRVTKDFAGLFLYSNWQVPASKWQHGSLRASDEGNVRYLCGWRAGRFKGLLSFSEGKKHGNE